MAPLWLLVAALAAVGIFGIVRVVLDTRSPRGDSAEVVVQRSQDVRMNIAQLQAHKLYLFRYAGTDHPLRFFVRRNSHSEIEAALASCRGCYNSKQPHYSMRGQLMCGECNHPMELVTPMDKSATERICKLHSVPHSIEGTDIVVRARDVEQQTARLLADAAAN